MELFAEDQAHEEFLKPLIHRLAAEEGLEVDIVVRSARGGHSRALRELALHQRVLSEGFQRSARPDAFVAATDANCQPYGRARKAILDVLKDPFRQVTAVACPDPHVERWYMADPRSFAEVVGKAPQLRRRKCDRHFYKEMLTRLVAESGHPSTLGGIEFAQDLVKAMDLYRAGKNEKSLKHFVDDMRTLLKRR